MSCYVACTQSLCDKGLPSAQVSWAGMQAIVSTLLHPCVAVLQVIKSTGTFRAAASVPLGTF
jgi:hypothetical protein